LEMTDRKGGRLNAVAGAAARDLVRRPRLRDREVAPDPGAHRRADLDHRVLRPRRRGALVPLVSRGAASRRPSYIKPKVCARRKRFTAEMRAATTAAAVDVARWFTSTPMTSRRLVKRTSGTSAKGIPNESTTWLITSVRDGST